MDIEQIRDYCLQKPGATEDQAFGPDGLLFRVNGKIFAYLNLERQLSVGNERNSGCSLAI